MKVVKFGGSSLAGGPVVENAVKIILSDPERRVVVTSAPGKRDPNDVKVTDLLIKFAEHVVHHRDWKDVAQRIFRRYTDIGSYFNIPEEEIEPLRKQLFSLPTVHYPNRDYLLAAFKAHGECLNAQLIAKVLTSKGANARYVDPKVAGIQVTGTPNNATVSPETYLSLENFEYSDDEILVFPGFYGYTMAGHIATFSRGGSDITGAILARGFHADLYENFTDVDAIFSANPTVVDNPRPISTMTYREMRELSYAGFSVFHDEALIPAIQGQIPINVKNTRHPEKRGTMIVPEKGFTPENTVTGIASSKHFAALYLHKYLLNKEVGFTLRLLRILSNHNVPYEHMPTGIDDLTIIFDKNYLTDALVDEICDEIQSEVNPDKLEWHDDYAIIMVVGEGMRDHIGVLRDIVTPVSNAGISFTLVNQGSSQISIMVGTTVKDADNAVRAIYNYLFTGENDND